jgi:transposase
MSICFNADCRANFIPPRSIRQLRDLTRQRTQLIRQRKTMTNRLQKVLEDANIKLASVATDVLGVSGRALIAEGPDPARLVGLGPAATPGHDRPAGPRLDRPGH